MEFKASEIDQVLEKLLIATRPLYDYELQEEMLPEWQLLKVKSIYKYLYENYQDMFGYATRSLEYGIVLGVGDEHKETWTKELQKGGFTAFWKKKEDFKTSIKNVMSNANIGVSVVKSIVELVDKFV